MKKLFAAASLLALLAVLAPPTATAARRLNFMLTNLTGVDITDVRIAPTYYPQSQSENLLKTSLEPNTRLYIGPNYYGDQRYWSIGLTWANGFTWTWTHQQLARYNSYEVSSGAYGPRILQCYERAFARYGGPMPSMFAGSQSGVQVAVGVPEKVNIAPNSAPAYNMVASNTRRTTRDLVFDDDDEADRTPKVAGSASDTVKGEKIAVKATVELTRNNKTTTVLPTEDFKSGDKVHLLFSANRDGRVYWLAKGTSGQYQVLFPNAKAGMDNAIVKNKEYTVPVKGAWKFDDNKGTETLVCIVSPSSVAVLDKAVALAGEGKKDDASGLVSGVVNGHETKRTTRDLVFEEEDNADVNTKTQVSPDNEPFVATYELVHN
jgi:hypothetical protein